MISKWDIIFVKQACHERPHVEVTPVKGSRKFHSVRSVKQGYQIEARSLSCFCLGCLNNTACENTAWVEPWETKHLKLKGAVETCILFIMLPSTFPI